MFKRITRAQRARERQAAYDKAMVETPKRNMTREEEEAMMRALRSSSRLLYDFDAPTLRHTWPPAHKLDPLAQAINDHKRRDYELNSEETDELPDAGKEMLNSNASAAQAFASQQPGSASTDLHTDRCTTRAVEGVDARRVDISST